MDDIALVRASIHRQHRASKSSKGGSAGKLTSHGRAYDFCNEDGVLLLNKVVLGKVRQVSTWGEVKRCPEGYNSVSKPIHH
jgi:hypothetical protein